MAGILRGIHQGRRPCNGGRQGLNVYVLGTKISQRNSVLHQVWQRTRPILNRLTAHCVEAILIGGMGKTEFQASDACLGVPGCQSPNLITALPGLLEAPLRCVEGFGRWLQTDQIREVIVQLLLGGHLVVAAVEDAEQLLPAHGTELIPAAPFRGGHLHRMSSPFLADLQLVRFQDR